MDTFFEIFTLVAILYATMSGVVLGSTALLYFSLNYPPAVVLPVRRQIPLSVMILVLLGATFFAGQITQAYLTGDDQFGRIVARFALWLVFSTAVAVSHSFARSFAIRREPEYILPSMEQRLNIRADARALTASADSKKDYTLNLGIKKTVDDTQKRVSDIQGRNAGVERRRHPR